MSIDLLEDFLSDDELASAFRIGSKRTLDRLRRQGQMPPSVVRGRKHWTHKDDARAYIQALREKAANRG